MLVSLIGLVAAAHAGDVAGQVSVDSLHARSVSTEAGAGPSEALSSTELGFRVQLDLRELDNRLEVEIDYRDREPIGGTFQNQPIRVLYTGEVRYEVLEDRLELAAGRFLAPAPIFTPVDGARAELFLGDWSLGAYGGRRGVSQSRQNLPLADVLPAAGGVVRHQSERVQFLAMGGYAEDRLILLTANPVETDIATPHAMANLAVRPVDPLRVGAEAAFTEQVSYLIGPSWSDLTVEAEALDVFRTLGWVDYTPVDWFGVLADVHLQRVGNYAIGTVDAGGERVRIQEPRFTDLRLEGDIGLWKRGWLRPLGRYRIRADRREIRSGAQLDVDDLGVAGPFLSGRLFFDEIEGDVPDRLIWAASGGWNRGILEVEAGASFIEREAAPFGGRRLDGASGEDLNPFVLEAQKVAFLRGFVSDDSWFAGLDLEQSLVAPEFRILVQVGALGEVRW